MANLLNIEATQLSAEATDPPASEATEQLTLDPTEKLGTGSKDELSSHVSHDIAWDQIQGRRRSQQDCAVCIPMGVGRHLLVLADGMGGHAAGDVASSVAVTGFCSAFEAPGIPEDPNKRMMAALEAANYAIHDRVVVEPELIGMGTTLVAAVVEGRELRWVSVGDSPLWLVRDGEIRRLNANHSVAGQLAEQVAAGEMTAAEAAEAPGRAMLFSALLGEYIDLVDAPEAPVRLEPGDVIMIASDGVETCGPDELTGIVCGGNDAAAELVERILAAVEDYEDRLPGQRDADRMPSAVVRESGGFRIISEQVSADMESCFAVFDGSGLVLWGPGLRRRCRRERIPRVRAGKGCGCRGGNRPC